MSVFAPSDQAWAGMSRKAAASWSVVSGVGHGLFFSVMRSNDLAVPKLVFRPIAEREDSRG